MRRRELIAGLASAAAWPVLARAQQQRRPVLGFLDWRGPQRNSDFMKAFRGGLTEAGFVEGRNLSIEYRWANGNLSELPSMAADLVRHQAEVIVAAGARPPVFAAKNAAPKIPIAFLYGGDPVKDGIVASLSRPGGNLTGIAVMMVELAGKRLDLLLKMVPRMRKVGFLSGKDNRDEEQAMLAAGRALGVEIIIVESHSERDFETAAATMVEGGADAMVLAAYPFRNLDKVISLAALYKLPTIYPFAGFARVGGLMTYETDMLPLYRRLGSFYAAQILKGDKPADLPVEQPTKFKLAINLKTAKAIDVDVPPQLLAIADEVIE